MLDDIAEKYNNKVYRTIKMKPTDVTSDSYSEYNEDTIIKHRKFKVGDHVRISKCKNIFVKGYTSNCSEEIFTISRIENTVPWAYFVSCVNGEKIVGTFYEKELKKTNQKEFRLEKVIQKRGDKLFVKWKGYDNSFNSCIDKKDIV